MLSLSEQKERLAKVLNSYPLEWQENKTLRYRIRKPNSNKASLWLRITKKNETFAITTTGEVISDIADFIKKLTGLPHNLDGNHCDWLDVTYNNACKIVNKFGDHYAVKIEESLTEQIIDYIRAIEELPNIGSTEKRALIQSRIGQGMFREGLIDMWGSCSVTKYNQLPLLIASQAA